MATIDFRRVVVEAVEDAMKKQGLEDKPQHRISILVLAHEHLIRDHQPSAPLNQFLLAIENEVAFLQSL